MPRGLVVACSCAFVMQIVLIGAQQPDPAQAEALARRAAERLQALHDEADKLATDERTLLGELRRLELEREIRAEEAEQARTALDAATSEVASLERQIAALNQQSTADLPDLEARLVTLYKLGRGRYARLLLSASDLRQFGQAVRLVSAVAEQDRQRVSRYQQRIGELGTARTAAQDRRARLARLQGDAQHAQAAADEALAARRALVSDIDARRDLNAQYSAELLTAQQRLQASLAGMATSVPALPLNPFKGDLPWPAPGPVRHGFGSAVGGRPPLRGIEVASDPGTEVRAVTEGAVAFADTFSGYGRLVIVDHGNQTFTLYGNLGEIRVSKGTRVTRGQIVGTAGPGADEAGDVYFELRIDGRPVDPVQWLTKR